MAKKPTKKAPAKAGKKPSRGIAKKAPVRVKAPKPKARALHVPRGDVGHAYVYEEGHLADAVALAEQDAGAGRRARVAAELAAASSAAVDFGAQADDCYGGSGAFARTAPLTRFQRFRAWLRGLFGA